MDFQIETGSPLETQNLAKDLASLLSAGDIISLTGDLGAGKTCFTQGLAKGLGIKEHITSPTFNLIKEYQGRLPLYHFDIFRLERLEDMFDLGYEDYFYGCGVTVIEWGMRISSLLPDGYVEIELRRLEEENRRRLIVRPHGKIWRKKIKEWLEHADIRI